MNYLKNTLFTLILLSASLANAQSSNYLLALDNNFTQISNFSAGLARVVVDYDSVRFIDTSGEFAFPQAFEAAGNFHSGRAWVRKRVNGEYKYGFINKQGNFVIPPQYYLALDFHNGRAVVRMKNGQVNYLINPLKN